MSAACAPERSRWARPVGLPLRRFPFERTADGHEAVESGTVGKALIDLV
ncbi:hypothetical protein OG589_39665 [Sphaerisporangium sp. NBC_01403]